MNVSCFTNSIKLLLLPRLPSMQILCLPLSLYLNRASCSTYRRPQRAKIPFRPRSPASNVPYSSQMDTLNDEIAHEFRFFRVYKDGRVEKFQPTPKMPPSDDPVTGVRSKDVISSKPPISARIFLPKINDPTRKLPVLFYIHGGGFCFLSAFSPLLHNYASTLAAESNLIAVSVEYRLAPEHPIPACYEDSWAAFQWVASHANGNGPESWLNDHADFDRVFLAGDSAGGNISHNLAVRFGSTHLPDVKLVGAILVHPYFGGTDDDKMWLYMCPENSGLNDPRLKPAAEDLERVGCKRVLVFVGGKDHLREVGWRYYEELKKSGWEGRVEIVENEGEDHCFHLEDLKQEKAVDLLKRFASFINQEQERSGFSSVGHKSHSPIPMGPTLRLIGREKVVASEARN